MEPRKIMCYIHLLFNESVSHSPNSYIMRTFQLCGEPIFKRQGRGENGIAFSIFLKKAINLGYQKLKDNLRFSFQIPTVALLDRDCNSNQSTRLDFTGDQPDFSDNSKVQSISISFLQIFSSSVIFPFFSELLLHPFFSHYSDFCSHLSSRLLVCIIYFQFLK